MPHWGKRKENGIWLASVSRRRLMHPRNPGGHDSVFVALGRLRVRIIVRGLHGERKAHRA